MATRTTGWYDRTAVAGEEVAAFVPAPLPPDRPPLILDGNLVDRLRAAQHAVMRLELAGEMVPSIDWFIYAFVRKDRCKNRAVRDSVLDPFCSTGAKGAAAIAPGRNSVMVDMESGALKSALLGLYGSRSSWRAPSKPAARYLSTI